jgi:adenine nucleotide transporter 17
MPEETIASEVLAASLGGAVSASMLYPLEVLKTKMQAVDEDDENKDDDMLTFATKLYEKEGLSVFLRGMETSAFQSALEKALYFFSYTILKGGYGSMTGGSKPIGAFPHLMLGCLAEWAHLPVSLPVDYWTTQIQTSNEKPMQILLTMLQMKDKRQTWYKGLSAYYVLCFKPALQYTFFEQVKQMWVKHRRNKNLTSAEAFLLGMLARAVSTVLVFPYVRGKVLLQKAKADDNPDAATANRSMSSVLWECLERNGFASLYQGLGPELTRGVFSAALMLMIKERLASSIRQMLLGNPAETKRSLRA